MSDTPRTDAEALKSRPPFTFVTRKFAEDLERECNQLRAALQSVIDWNPKPEYWERPETVARFEADMARARKVLEEAQETKPHQKWWEVLEETE